MLHKTSLTFGVHPSFYKRILYTIFRFFFFHLESLCILKLFHRKRFNFYQVPLPPIRFFDSSFGTTFAMHFPILPNYPFFFFCLFVCFNAHKLEEMVCEKVRDKKMF